MSNLEPKCLLTPDLIQLETRFRPALLSSAFFSRAIEYFCIKDFINLVVRKGSEISNDPWRTGI